MPETSTTIDTTPSSVATNALQAIPFGALIGAPLSACIDAQAKAAKTTVDFITAVGLNTDKDGNKSAVNVTFTYVKANPTQTGDQKLSLTVPLLTIVPIPYLRVDDLSIKFKANISADADVKTSTATSMEGGGDLSASAKFWVVDASLKAHFSAKKDSTAAASSKYAVEYTMDVELHATNDDMPAGLAKVLNILTESIAAVPPAALTATYDAATGGVSAKLADANGRSIPGAVLTFTVVGGSGNFGGAPPAIARTATTDNNGVASVTVTKGDKEPIVRVDYNGPGAVSKVAAPKTA